MNNKKSPFEVYTNHSNMHVKYSTAVESHIHCKIWDCPWLEIRLRLSRASSHKALYYTCMY